jgi:hypothetical protein
MHASRPARRVTGTARAVIPRGAVTVTAAALVGLVILPLTACGGASGNANDSPTVPALANSTGPGAGAGSSAGASQAPGSGHESSPTRAAALHDAAQCIRSHGIPGYADPVLTPSGATYSDQRSFQNAGQSTVDAVHHACGTLMAQASLNPESEPPAPPQLVQAGVRNSQCYRAHGLPNVKDPTAQTPYVPGHGFSLTADQIPSGGKQSPAFQQAIQACIQQDRAEITASTLASLGNDG